MISVIHGIATRIVGMRDLNIWQVVKTAMLNVGFFFYLLFLISVMASAVTEVVASSCFLQIGVLSRITIYSGSLSCTCIFLLPLLFFFGVI